MRVVVDRYIPYLEALAEHTEVVALSPEEITPEVVREVDALIVRTRTHCNAELLAGSRVRFIATATIGFDHIDTAYCEEQGIRWMNCPGCNAQGVCDYVESAIACLSPLASTPLHIGIVGLGHVGRLVQTMAEQKGWQVAYYDPFVEGGVASLSELTDCDVVTFHTPLTQDGPYPTFHMADSTFLQALRPGAVLINAARGGVVDEQALAQRPDLRLAIDCWEGEPHINPDLCQRAELSTFHIAGYTEEGKYNASAMALQGLSEHFGLPAIAMPTRPAPAPHCWDIRAVSDSLKAAPTRFESLRKAYPLR